MRLCHWIVSLTIVTLVLTGCTKDQKFLIIGGCELKPATSCPGVDLSGQNLAGLDLRNSNFTGAIFDDADLSSAILINSNLSKASLQRTNLEGANLTDADLTQANLLRALMLTTSVDEITWSDTICPDGTNSDDNGGTCVQNLANEDIANNDPNPEPEPTPQPECDPEEHQTDDDNCGCDGACEDGHVCNFGECVPRCVLEGCGEPAPSCDGNVLVTVEGEGQCNEETGRCDFSQVESRLNCELGNLGCRDGACADLCEGVDCTRPQDFCDEDVAHSFDGGNGACDFRTGHCTPEIVEETQDCSAEEELCQQGACIDLCEGVSCPVFAECEGDVVVESTQEGVCAFRSGQCEYEGINRTDCQGFGRLCRGGQCVPTQCANGELDEGETDVDCGGEDCLGCLLGQSCLTEEDCESQGCFSGRCGGPAAEFVEIPAGSFTMGSPNDERGRTSNETQHEVTLTRSFFMQTTEVTQGQWRGLVGNNPSSFTACGDDCPVERVSWFDAVAFANAKSSAEGLEPCYDDQGAVVGDPDGNPYNCEGYRLPTEAEWEYAARGGTQTAFFTGEITQTLCEFDANLDRAGWYCGNANNTTHPVGEKEANAFGLFDLHGNVWEWVHDLYQGNYEALSGVDPVNTDSGSFRVIRGGSWFLSATFCRAASRDYHDPPGSRINYYGFRLVRSIN